MIKEAIFFLGACAIVACSHRTEPETPATSEDQQLTPASRDERGSLRSAWV